MQDRMQEILRMYVYICIPGSHSCCMSLILEFIIARSGKACKTFLQDLASQNPAQHCWNPARKGPRMKIL